MHLIFVLVSIQVALRTCLWSPDENVLTALNKLLLTSEDTQDYAQYPLRLECKEQGRKRRRGKP